MIVNAAVVRPPRGIGWPQYDELCRDCRPSGHSKIPKGTVLPMHEMPNIPDRQSFVICTGGQGEPRAALQRMAEGEHRHIKLKGATHWWSVPRQFQVTRVRYQEIGNDLIRRGVTLLGTPRMRLRRRPNARVWSRCA